MTPQRLEHDTLRTRTRSAIERMEQAAAWLTNYQRQGHQVRVEWTEEWICLVNQHGNPLEHPLGLLPELMWLLKSNFGEDIGAAFARKQAEAIRDAHQRGNGGGVA
jgi:hypothetical protein